MTEHQIKLLVFRELCKHECDFMSSYIPLPCTLIAQDLGISVYQCRKQMRKLVDNGLAKPASIILSPEESRLPYRGFAITEKGVHTDIYRYCALKAARHYAPTLGGSVEAFLPADFDMRWLGYKTKDAGKCIYYSSGFCTHEDAHIPLPCKSYFGNCAAKVEVKNS